MFMQFNYKNSLMICLLCLFPLFAAAQTYNMGGTVHDEEGLSLPGVSIYLKAQAAVGTTTDANGKFKIKASKGDVLVFSYIGYETQEYLVDAENEKIVVRMNPSYEEIEEVVVTALGSQRKISVVGAVTAIDVKDLQTPATSIVNMLGGRVAGIITQLGSGEPGKNLSEFWVRGIGTFGASNAALVLIDGLEGDLNAVDPADVESFSILKDASATAVYGVRGANGVVLITTKRGQSGKLQIKARVNYALSYLNRMPEYLRAYDYAVLANEARVVRNEEILYDNMELRLIRNHLDDDLYPDIDWQKEIIKRNGFQQTYYMSAQGGGDAARYFISLGTSIEDAAYKVAPENTIRSGVGYNTYNYRINLDIDLVKGTTLEFGSAGFMSLRTQPGYTNTDDMWAAQSMLTPVTVPLRYSTGELPAYSSSYGGSGISPYVLLNYTGKQTNQHYTGKAKLTLTHDMSYLLKDLKVKVQGSYDNLSWKDERRYVMPELYMASGRTTWGELQRAKSFDASSPQYSLYQRQSRKYHMDATITWDQVIAEDHRVSALVYYEMSDDQDTRDAEVDAGRRALEALPKRYQGISSRLTYGYRNTYMVDFNFGYTGSENFEKGRQFGFFPSIAVGWVPTSYAWISEQMPWLNYFKIRGSYGSVGSDRIADFRFPFMTIVGENQSVGWGSTLNGVTELQFGANNLLWEKSLKSDMGIEGNFLDNRLTFVVDFFNDKRENIFQRRENIPGYVGLIYSARPYGNVGSMRNFGSDGNISYTHVINDEWNITVRGNYTYSTNEIINWEEPPTRYPYQPLNGYPLGAIKGYIATGLFADEDDIAYSAVQSFGGFKVMPGDIKYKDINGDGVINTDDRVFLSDSSFPKLMYGFGGELQYKSFTLGILFKGTGKTDIYHVGYDGNGPGYMPFNNGRIGNVLTMVNDPANRWIPMDYAVANGIDPALAENPNARFPRLSYGYNANNSQLSTHWRNDARYLRLQEITVNYNLKANFLRRFGLSSADIQFVGNNLYIWDKIKDWDPEQGNKNGRAYPIPSRYAMQLYLNF
jgi:TonB-linked SusC/RagA family outer membrane protein